jgi:hypothetical protein
MRAYFRKQIYLPQDHGSWVFIISPLLIGLLAGGRFSFASFSLVAAAMLAFLMRQPVTIVKAYSGRRSKEDLPAARFSSSHGGIVLLPLIALVEQGFLFVLYLAIPGVLYLPGNSAGKPRGTATGWHRSSQPACCRLQHPQPTG